MLLGVAAPAIPAESLLEEIQQRGVLRIGTPGDYPPYSLSTADQHLVGADISLAREIALSLGVRAEFVTTSWATLTDDALRGQFDIAVGGISITPQRKRLVDFTKPYLNDSKQPVVRCGEQSRYGSRSEINSPGVRLIVNRGGTNEAFSRTQFPQAALTVHADNRTVFDEINAGRADVMVTDAVEARLQQMRGQGLCTLKVGRWAPAGKAVLVRKDGALRLKINHSVSALGGRGKYAVRLAPWMEDAAHPTIPAAARLATLVDERLALVVEVARYKWNTGAAIEDPPREQALLLSLRDQAAALGLPQQRVDSFFRAQIEAAKQLQRELFERWQRERRKPFVGIADLATSIRPGIDTVTQQMLQTLALLPASGSVQWPRASTIAGISPGAVQTARAPLLIGN